MTVSLEEAVGKLELLVKDVVAGEEVVITQNEQPLAKLVAVPQQQRRKPGSAQGMVWMAPDFDEPLEDFKDYM